MAGKSGAGDEIAAARERARESAPERESLADPALLPELPEVEELTRDKDERVGDHIPDAFLYHPSESTTLWLDIWERDLRFKVSSHRGLLGRVVIALKHLLAPLVRAPLAAELQRERIAHIVLLRRLALFERTLVSMREPYEFVKDRAVPDLIARSDAIYAILDRRLDTLEAEIRSLRAAIEAAPGRR